MTAPLLKLPAADLHHALSTVLPFIGTDRSLPLLRHVHISERDQRVRFTATDRYTAVRVETEAVATVDRGFEALIELDDVKAMVRSLKGHGGLAYIERNDDRHLVGHNLIQTTAVTDYDALGQWPNLDRVLAEPAIPAEPEAARFTAKLIGKLGKLTPPPSQGRGPLYVTQLPSAAGKPSIFVAGDWLTVAIMQARPES